MGNNSEMDKIAKAIGAKIAALPLQEFQKDNNIIATGRLNLATRSASNKYYK
jgi:hypothetical protein